MPKEKIVVVDDDEFMREGLLETLERPEFSLFGFDNATDGIDAISDGSATLLITDMRMPGMSGMELLEQARRLDPKLPVVMMTAFATIETAVTAMKTGAFDYIMKPFDANQIEMVVEKALRHRRLLAENEYLKGELARKFSVNDFVGGASCMKSVFEQIRQVAPSGATVFIRGESGTGKELVARSIHAQSPRRERPMIRVNCAALSAGVLESELFGHEKGAFTGADKRRIGRFEMAEGGTLFLDEVSEMDLALQGKLLRVLQEKEFERVGSSETISADVRILASSNRDLEDAISEGTFRQDLFYRLNVVSVDLPPLRERKDDIPDLVKHFIEKYNREEGTHVRAITDDALGVLRTYDWPGNVRELENIIERAIVLGTGELIDVPQITSGLSRGGKVPAGAVGGSSSGQSFEPVPLETVERDHIMKTLDYFNHHRQNTALALGISERSLRDRLKRWSADDLTP